MATTETYVARLKQRYDDEIRAAVVEATHERGKLAPQRADLQCAAGVGIGAIGIRIAVFGLDAVEPCPRPPGTRREVLQE